MTNNLQQTSIPPCATFASAVAQNPLNSSSNASSKQNSPVKVTTAPVAVVDQSPVVKLPASVAAVGNNAGMSSVVTIDGSKNVQPSSSIKANPIKFGSFAAAAAAVSISSQNENSAASNSGLTLPPRTQSAPPSVIEQQKAVIAPVSHAIVPDDKDESDPAVVLPSIQEDNSLPQYVSFNYEEDQQQYQQRPPHYQQNHNGQQRYFNQQQHQQNGNYFPQQYHHNMNYRPHHNPNYRPRPQYYPQQGGYYPPQLMNQGGFYPSPMQGYYRPPLQRESIPVGPAAVPFQRPAPALNNYVRPAVAPVVPANMPSFTAVAVPAVVTPVSLPEQSSVAPIPVVAAPVFVKPAASKIKIVDPSTGKEINFGSKPASVEDAPKKEESTKLEVVSEPVKPVEPVKVAEPVKPVEIQKVVEPAKPSVPVVPAKKISIVIKDPNSHKELDLSQVVSRPVVKEDLAVEELTAAFTQSANLEEAPVEQPLENTATISGFQHDKTILANLNVDDDELSSDDEDYSDYSSDEEDEEEIFIPSTILFGQSITYPAESIPFVAPSEENGVWLYSREFLLQFRDKCTTTPGDLQERLSAAVEKAKAFASSERMNGDRSNRREGQREDRKKRRNNNSTLGPQAHLLDMNAVLKNRAENAWAPVRSAEELSQSDRILREVKGLLNKLTLEKFHVISDKILALGIMSPDVLSGVIDSVFDKSVNEPRFAAMYAELCYKIVVEELNGLKKTLPANSVPDSQFRRLLVERCQAEYKHKRAWSKKRLEKLLETTVDKQESTEEPSATETPAADSDVAATKKANVGELTEEDYLLIKLKRRVLGNMRFIGEIFKVGLIGEKIMHSIITELLSNVENPEEEEIECLCRLLMTVGAILDKPEAANFWNQYVGRMNWLISQSEKLSSRVRFLVMDTLELREKKWKTGKSEEGPKTIAQIEKEQQMKERNDRDKEREYRGDRDRNKQSAPPMKFTSKQQQPQQQKSDEWNRSGPSKSSSNSANLNRNSSVRRSQAPQQPMSPASSVVVENPISSPSLGRFGVLEIEENESSSLKEDSSNINEVKDEERVKKIISLLDELIQMNNYEDVYEEIKACPNNISKSSALSGLLNRAIENGKKTSLSAVIKVYTECSVIDRSVQVEACKMSFGMIDDLAVDVPSIYETAGQLNSAMKFSLPEIFETLADCSDDMAKTRVILQTISALSDADSKDQLLKDSKEFVEKNKKPGIENLMKKLNIEI